MARAGTWLRGCPGRIAKSIESAGDTGVGIAEDTVGARGTFGAQGTAGDTPAAAGSVPQGCRPPPWSASAGVSRRRR